MPEGAFYSDVAALRNRGSSTGIVAFREMTIPLRTADICEIVSITGVVRIQPFTCSPTFPFEVAMHVEILVRSLFCFQGEDNEESEPYLWTIMAALDGTTVKQNGDKLVGSPRYFFGPGSHGNIGGGIVSGVTRNIPPEIGKWELDMEPIEITLGTGATVEIPGSVTLVARLFEENLTPNDAMEAGHQAVNQMVQSNMQDFVNGFSIAEATAGVQQLILDAKNNGETLDPLTAAIREFNNKFAPTKKVLATYAEPVGFEAIAKNLGFWGAIGVGIDGDTPIGGASHTWSMLELANRSNPFTDQIGTVERGGSVYNLHGLAWGSEDSNTILVPAASELSPGRYQVTGVIFERGVHARFINYIGGPLADGSPWVITRNQGVNYISSGQYSFFVHGDDGSEADLYVVTDDPKIDHPYLKTHRDASRKDNLESLPECITQTVKQRA